MTSLLKFIVLTYFYVACELYQPLGKTEFSSVAKTEQTLSHRLEYKYLSWVYGVDRKICHGGN